MIYVEVLKERGAYREFKIDGHAGYAEEGEDIVCAAVSALVINTVNSIEEFTDDAFTCDCEDGMVKSFAFPEEVSDGTALLMDSLMLGLHNIREAYGAEYLEIRRGGEQEDKT